MDNLRVVFFGAGSDCEQMLLRMNLILYLFFDKKKMADCIIHIVDNCKERQGDIMFGKCIESPKILKKRDLNKNILIVVTSNKYYSAISQQLRIYGYEENIDFVSFSLFFKNILARFSIRKINERLIEKIKEMNLIFSHNVRRKTVALFFGYGCGGISPSLENTAKYLANQGFRVDIYIDKCNKSKRMGIGLEKIEGGNIFVFQIEKKFFLCIGCFLQMIHQQRKDIDYSFFIGFDPHGLFPAAVLGDVLNIPVLYHSLEFYEDDGWEKEVEHFFAPKAFCVLTQDEMRVQKLTEILKIANKKILVAYNSSIGQIIRDGGNYFREKFHISQEKKIVLFAGTIMENFYIQEILESALTWSDHFVLIIHGWCYDELFKKKILNYVDFKRIFLSTEVLTSEDKYEAFKSADIGLVFYKPINSNLKYAAGSSGKLYDFMRCGIPVVANDIPGMRELVEKNNIGEIVSNFKEINMKLNMILEGYREYRENCFSLFPQYEFSSQYSHVLEYINSHVN